MPVFNQLRGFGRRTIALRPAAAMGGDSLSRDLAISFKVFDHVIAPTKRDRALAMASGVASEQLAPDLRAIVLAGDRPILAA